MKNKLNEVWDFLGGNKTISDVAVADKGKVSEKTAQKMIARGECVVCRKFAEEALTHESPGTAKCCKGCPAEEGAK